MKNFFFRVGIDIPILDEYEDDTITFMRDGEKWEPDFDPDDFFVFISDFNDIYKNLPQLEEAG